MAGSQFLHTSIYSSRKSVYKYYYKQYTTTRTRKTPTNSGMDTRLQLLTMTSYVNPRKDTTLLFGRYVQFKRRQKTSNNHCHTNSVNMFLYTQSSKGNEDMNFGDLISE